MAPPTPFQLILPICTASATAGLSIYQYPLFASFLYARPSIAGRPLSGFWNAFQPGASVRLFTDLATAVSASIAYKALDSVGTRSAVTGSKWYLYGASLAAAHLLFVPIISGPIKRMAAGAGNVQHDKAIDEPLDWTAEQTIEERNRREQVWWLQLHTIRTVLLDLPALWCLSQGVGHAIGATGKELPSEIISGSAATSSISIMANPAGQGVASHGNPNTISNQQQQGPGHQQDQEDDQECQDGNVKAKNSWMKRTFKHRKLSRAKSIFSLQKKSQNGTTATSSGTTSRGTTSRVATSYGNGSGSKSHEEPRFEKSKSKDASEAEGEEDTARNENKKPGYWSSVKSRLSRKSFHEEPALSKEPTKKAEDEWKWAKTDESFRPLRDSLRCRMSRIFENGESETKPVTKAPLRVIQAAMRPLPPNPEDTNDTSSENKEPARGPHPHQWKWRLGFDGTIDNPSMTMGSLPTYKSLTVSRRRFKSSNSSSELGNGNINGGELPKLPRISGNEDLTTVTTGLRRYPYVGTNGEMHRPSSERLVAHSGPEGTLIPSKKLFNGTVRMVADGGFGMLHNRDLSHDASADPLVPRSIKCAVDGEEKRGRSPTPRPRAQDDEARKKPRRGSRSRSDHVKDNRYAKSPEEILEQGKGRSQITESGAASQDPSNSKKCQASDVGTSLTPSNRLELLTEAQQGHYDKIVASKQGHEHVAREVPAIESSRVLDKRRIAKESLNFLLTEKEIQKLFSDTDTPIKSREGMRRRHTHSSSYDSGRVETEFVESPHGFQALKHTAMKLIPHSAGSRRWRSQTGSSFSYDSSATGSEAIVARRSWRKPRDANSMTSDTTLDDDADFVVDEELQRRADEHSRRLRELEL
ncbi:MAG: hypothetical protein M1828_004314 [Chrysothrix sp. TS-e1954]|nr:MAG: hypothetical protein M1828_004314 [Chrysothrix sp. TS-e1954]